MKSERRHELQHNELAEWLFKVGEWLKPYQNHVFAVVAVVAVIVISVLWYSKNEARKTDQAWADLNNAVEGGSLDLFTKVAQDNSNAVVGQTAAVLLGDLRLSLACEKRFSSITMAQKEWRSAKESYTQVLDSNAPDALRERATFGLARVNETEGQVDAAKRLYRDVVNQWPHGAYAVAAKQRLADFDKPETMLMFASLKEFQPKTEFSDEPGALGGPSSSSPPTFDMPKEPPIGNGTPDIGGDLLSEPGKKPSTSEPSKPGDQKKPDKNASPEKKTAEKPPAAKKTDAPSKKKP